MTHPLMHRVARSIACLVAIAVLAGAKADAAYFLTASNPILGTSTQGGTTINFAAVTPQAGFNGPSSANVINVTIDSTTLYPANDTFSFSFSQDIFVSGTTNTPNMGGAATFRLTGTFNVTNGQAGAILSSVTNAAVTLVSGSGFLVTYQGYAAPTPTNVAGGSDGAISVNIVPTTGFNPSVGPVPEPASVLMVGLGLAGVGLTALRRRQSA